MTTPHHVKMDLEAMQSRLSDLGKNSFLKPQWFIGLYREIETSNGTSIVPQDVCDSEDPEDHGDFAGGVVDSVSDRRQGWLCRLSAPSYMDCTDWQAFSTEHDALEYLLCEMGDDQ